MHKKILGWVLLLVLVISALPVTAQTPTFVVTTDNVRVRAQPTVSSPSLQVIPINTTVQVNGRDQGVGWLQVSYRGVIGWISAFYVAANFNLSTLPIVDATVNNPTRQEEQTAAPDGTIVQNGTLVVFSTRTNVNIRELPSTEAARIGLLPRNARALITLLDPTLTWGLTTYNGITGWISLTVVNVLGDIRTMVVAGDPNSGTAMPVPPAVSLTLEQRGAVQRVQDHLGLYVDQIPDLINLLESGAGGGIITCGPPFDFFAPYRPQRSDLELVPDLNAIIIDLNAAFTLLNRARAGWLTKCSAAGNTLTAADRASFGTWAADARAGNTVLANVQVRLAALTAR